MPNNAIQPIRKIWSVVGCVLASVSPIPALAQADIVPKSMLIPVADQPVVQQLDTVARLVREREGMLDSSIVRKLDTIRLHPFIAGQADNQAPRRFVMELMVAQDGLYSPATIESVKLAAKRRMNAQAGQCEFGTPTPADTGTISRRIVFKVRAQLSALCRGIDELSNAVRGDRHANPDRDSVRQGAVDTLKWSIASSNDSVIKRIRRRCAYVRDTTVLNTNVVSSVASDSVATDIAVICERIADLVLSQQDYGIVVTAKVDLSRINQLVDSLTRRTIFENNLRLALEYQLWRSKSDFAVDTNNPQSSPLPAVHCSADSLGPCWLKIPNLEAFSSIPDIVLRTPRGPFKVYVRPCDEVAQELPDCDKHPPTNCATGCSLLANTRNFFLTVDNTGRLGIAAASRIRNRLVATGGISMAQRSSAMEIGFGVIPSRAGGYGVLLTVGGATRYEHATAGVSVLPLARQRLALGGSINSRREARAYVSLRGRGGCPCE